MVNLWKLLLAIAAAASVLIMGVILSVNTLELTAFIWCNGGTSAIAYESLPTGGLAATCTDIFGNTVTVPSLLVIATNWVVYFVVIFVAMLPLKINLPEPTISDQAASDHALHTKLRELRTALTHDLITAEEFQLRRQEILDNFTKHPGAS